MNLNSRMRASSHSAVGEGPRAGEPGWGWGAIPCWPLQGGKNQTFLPPYAGARQLSSASSGNVCVGFQSHSTKVCLDVPFPFVIHQLVCCPSTPSASVLAPGSLPQRPDFLNKIHLLSSDNHLGFHGHLEPNVYGLASLSRPTICDWCVSVFPKETVLVCQPASSRTHLPHVPLCWKGPAYPKSRCTAHVSKTRDQSDVFPV